MIPIYQAGISEKQVTAHATSVLRVRGNFNGSTADRWLQFFDTNAVPADGSLPLIAAIPLPQTSPFFAEFEIGALPFALGCYVCVSTTQATKTLSADTMDLTVELDEPEFLAGSTFVGDLTTNVASLTVWADNIANTPKKLLSIEAINNMSSDAYLLLFANSAPSPGDIAIFTWKIQGFGVKQTLKMGEGINVLSRSDISKNYGCYLFASTTGGNISPTNNFSIKAEYK